MQTGLALVYNEQVRVGSVLLPPHEPQEGGIRFPFSLDKGESIMKENIHPTYGECIVRCACGETFKSGSTKGELKVEICSKCHPFYTGRQKLVDSGGRVDRFKKRYGM